MRYLIVVVAVVSLCLELAFASDVLTNEQAQVVPSAELMSAVEDVRRTASFAQRDQYRHPAQTLAFFGVAPDSVVAEIWPSSGWYAEIIAPYVKNDGQYYAVGFSQKAKRAPAWRKRMAQELIDKLATQPQWYGEPIVTGLSIPDDADIAPASSLDHVLTFRNVHNWMKGSYAQEVFDSMFAALKPGGILGVVEHRANLGTSIEDMIRSGYVTEAHVIALAKKSGFVLDARSEINANASDTKDYSEGVWTLPPRLKLDEQDQDKYLAIGESDRMTLRFLKP